MSTEKQRAAAQANGRKSNGPKTAAGKETSARNALKHGITAKKYLTPYESFEEFQSLYAALCEHHKPADAIECDLVIKITMGHWRIGRLLVAEQKMLDGGSLAEIFRADHDNRAKNMNAYEAANRNSIKQWEDMLAAYRKRREAATVTTLEVGSLPDTEDGNRATDKYAANPIAGGAAVAEAKGAEATEQNQKTNRISASGGDTSRAATEAGGGGGFGSNAHLGT